MTTLFISTYNSLIVIGLLCDDKLVMQKEAFSERNHSTYLVPLIDTILKENKLKVKDLDQIIVINGPGSFTGVRLGVTVAKTLAYTLNIPIKTITSLGAMAVSDGVMENKLISLSDAKGVYYAVYMSGEIISDIKYVSNDEFTKCLKINSYPHLWEVKLDISAINLALKESPVVSPHEVNPIYIKMIEVLK